MSSNNFPILTFYPNNYEKNEQNKQLLYLESLNLQRNWDQLAEKTLSVFEETTHGLWPKCLWKQPIRVILTSSQVSNWSSLDGFRIKLRIFDWSMWAEKNNCLGEASSTDRNLGTLIHELCHAFDEEKTDENFAIRLYGDRVVKENLNFGRDPIEVRAKRARSHIYIQLLWETVMRKLFSTEIVNKEIERARLLESSYKEAYRVLDQLSDSEKETLLDRRLHK